MKIWVCSIGICNPVVSLAGTDFSSERKDVSIPEQGWGGTKACNTEEFPVLDVFDSGIINIKQELSMKPWHVK